MLDDKALRLDVFAYDLNEPDMVATFLKLAGQGRIRIILDNASLHHNTSSPEPEDKFEKLFAKAAGDGAAILRGKFGRFAHDKVFIVSKKNGGPVKVLTGSTNFSITGLYVNFQSRDRIQRQDRRGQVRRGLRGGLHRRRERGRVSHVSTCR